MSWSHLFSVNNTLYDFKFGYKLSYIEAIGTVFGILCIWLASYEKIINFLFGVLNVTLFAMIFYQIHLYANMLLQIIFLLINIYGIYSWSRSGNEKLHIRWLSRKNQILIILVAIISTVILALYINQIFSFLTIYIVKIINLVIHVSMPVFVPDTMPWLDALITILSIIAMVQMAIKLIENWVLWLLVDILSIVLYASQGIYFIALEYMILSLIVTKGLIQWVKIKAKK